MRYQNRMRNYKSRREKLNTASRNVKVILIFSLIGACFWVIKEWQGIWDWFRLKFFVID
ncbi:MAG TPA: hypothetical protein PKE06_27910 [Flavilitoribacter sp.]|nr:hypothetical protein [Flavilitoribacter sp.]HMQ86069.1 hypothetical protein [Flavilitoribacter sp.]